MINSVNLEKSLENASNLLQKSKSKLTDPKETIEQLDLLSSNLLLLHEKLSTQANRMLTKQTEQIRNVSLDQVDLVFQVQQRMMRNHLQQIQELKNELLIWDQDGPNSKATNVGTGVRDSVYTKDRRVSDVHKLEEKVELIRKDVLGLSNLLRSGHVLQSSNTQMGKGMDYASIATTLKSLRVQTSKIKPHLSDDTFKKAPLKDSTSSNLARSPVKKVPPKDVPLGKLSSKPLKLSFQKPKPQETTQQRTMQKTMIAKRTNKVPTLIVHKRPAGGSLKEKSYVPLDFGYDENEPTVKVALEDKVDVKNEKVEDVKVHKEVESKVVKEQKDEGVQHAVRNVSIQHGHEDSLSISDTISAPRQGVEAERIEVMGESKKREEVVVQQRLGGKTMEQRLAEWIQQEVLLRLVKSSDDEEVIKTEQSDSVQVVPENVPKPVMVEADTQVKVMDIVTQVKVDKVAQVEKEIKEVAIQTKITSEFDSSVILISDTSGSITTPISSMSLSSPANIVSGRNTPSPTHVSVIQPDTPSPLKQVLGDQELDRICDAVLQQVCEAEIIQTLYEVIVEVMQYRAVTPPPTVHAATEMSRPPSPDTKQISEEVEWEHKHSLSAEESLLVDLQQVKLEALEQLQAERSRVEEMEKEKKAIEDELERLKKMYEEQSNSVVVGAQNILPPVVLLESPPRQLHVVQDQQVSPTHYSRTSSPQHEQPTQRLPSPEHEQKPIQDPSTDSVVKIVTEQTIEELEDSGYTPSYSSVIQESSQSRSAEKKDDTTISMTISSLPTLSEGELLFSLGEVGPTIEPILQSEQQATSSVKLDLSSSSEKKTSSGSMSEGQVVVLEPFLDPQSVTRMTTPDLDTTPEHSLDIHESSIRDEHSSSQIQSTSINISMIAPEEK